MPGPAGPAATRREPGLPAPRWAGWNVPRWREGHPVVGWAARPPQPRHGGLAEPPPTLAGVERLPAYAPELNPVEGLWSSLKAVELANLTSPTLAEVIDQAHRGIERVRRTPHLAYSFLRHAGLSVS